MTQLSKAALLQRAANLFPDNDQGEISPADLRDWLTDLVDSVEFLPAVSHAALVGWLTGANRDIAVADLMAAGVATGTVDHGVDIPALPQGAIAARLWFAVPLTGYGYPDHVSTEGFRQPDGAFSEQADRVTHDVGDGPVEFVIGKSTNFLGSAFVGQTMTWTF